MKLSLVPMCLYCVYNVTWEEIKYSYSKAACMYIYVHTTVCIKGCLSAVTSNLCWIRLLHWHNVSINHQKSGLAGWQSPTSRWRCWDGERALGRTVTWPSTPRLCLGTATRPSTLPSEPSQVQPGVGSHRHTHRVREGSVGRYCWGSPQWFSCCSDPH